jgi:hypothetical protein
MGGFGGSGSGDRDLGHRSLRVVAGDEETQREIDGYGAVDVEMACLSHHRHPLLWYVFSSMATDSVFHNAVGQPPDAGVRGTALLLWIGIGSMGTSGFGQDV